MELVGVYHAGYKGHGALNVVVGIDQLSEFMRKKKRIPRAIASEGSPGSLGPADRERVKETLGSGTLPMFDLGGLVVRAESTDSGAILYHVYGRQFPLDDRRVAVLEDLPKAPPSVAAAGAKAAGPAAPGGFGELGRLWVLGGNGWREWPQSALGADEHDLIARVTDSIRLQILHTAEYRRALANPGSQEERKRGREVSRTIARDLPVARDLSANLLETVDRLSAGREATVASTTEPAPSPAPIPPRGVP
jgi:hypothetical protein